MNFSSWPVLLSYKTLFIHTHTYIYIYRFSFIFIVLNAIFSNISATSLEAGVPGENHRPWQANGILYHLRLRAESTFFQYIKPGTNQRRIGDRLI